MSHGTKAAVAALNAVFAAVATAAVAAAAQPLHNGVPVTGLGGGFNDELHFLLQVPEGASDLRIGYSSGTGDASLYLRFDGQASIFDHHPSSPGPLPSGVSGGILLPSPSPGTWFILIWGLTDFSGFELEASYVCEEGCEPADIVELEDGVRAPGLGGAAGDQLFFWLEVPAGASELAVELSGGTGDADLFVMHNRPPTRQVFDCTSQGSGNDEACRLEAPAPGPWYVMVSAFDDFAGAELLATSGEASGCVATATSLCLNQGRFRVEVDWRTGDGSVGSAQVVPLGSFGSDDSGLFYFFSANNWEMLVKVLDGCGINDRFWVFAAATTDVEYTLHVTDTESGDVEEYFNPLGNAAAATTDTGAFDTCP